MQGTNSYDPDEICLSSHGLDRTAFRGAAWPAISRKIWWSQTGSNRRPHACKARALPTELWPRGDTFSPSKDQTDLCGRNVANSLSELSRGKQMVGLGRLELPTSRLSSARSNQLSYKPEPRMRPRYGQRRSRMKRHHHKQGPARRASAADAELGETRRTNRGTLRHASQKQPGSSGKKEKRRRRSPANGLKNLTTGSGCFHCLRKMP